MKTAMTRIGLCLIVALSMTVNSYGQGITSGAGKSIKSGVSPLVTSGKFLAAGSVNGNAGIPVLYDRNPQDIVMMKNKIVSPGVGGGTPVIDQSAPANPQPGGPNMGANFIGIGYTGFYPPDVSVAVGPDYIVEAVNESWEILDKSGAPQSSMTFSSWWAPVSPPTSIYEPKIVFDPVGQRYIMLALGYDAATKTSVYLLATSQTSSAFGYWWVNKLDATQDGSIATTNFADLPGLGYDAQAVYITSNQYNFTSGTFQYAKLRILDRSALEGGTLASWYDFWGGINADGTTAFTWKPAQTIGSSSAEYLLNTESGGGSTVSLWAVTNPLTSPSMTRQASISIGTYTVPPAACQLGGANLIQTGDCRTQDVAAENGYLYTAFTEGHNWGSGSVAALRILKINSSTSTWDKNTTYGADAYNYFCPATLVNGAGTMYVAFNRSGCNEYAHVRAVTEVWNDAASTLIKSGDGYHSLTRWGDYNGIALDPGGPVWVACETPTSSPTSWGTWIASLGGAASTVTLTVTSSPVTALPITVSPADKNGLSNGTTPFTRTYNNPTTVSLTAPAAPTGYVFQKWQLDGTDYATVTVTNVVMSANHTMTAVYTVTTPTIIVSVANLGDFGVVPVGTNSTSRSYTVSGSKLTGSIVITPPAGFKVSTDNSTFSSSISLPQSNGTVPVTTIYVRFSPTVAGLAAGVITHTSTGATTQNVNCSGTGGAPAIYVVPTSLTITQPPTGRKPASWIEYVPTDGSGKARPAGAANEQHGRGAIIPPSVQAYWATHPLTNHAEGTGLPTSIDWSNYDSPVKNQGSCGSCWAFAATALIENIGSQSDLAEQVLVSCIPGSTCAGGSYVAALDYFRDKGVPEESCYPYTSGNGTCGTQCPHPAFLERATGVQDGELWGSPAVANDIKTALQTGPIVVYMLVPSDGSFDSYTGGIYHYAGGTITNGGGHAILVVGYNDTQGCFKVKNSWGSWWGEGGYFRISYADLNNSTVFGSYATTATGIYSQVAGVNTFVIENTGTTTLTINTISTNKTWLSVTGNPATPFSLSPGGPSQTVTAVVNWSAVSGTSDVGLITIASNDPKSPSVTVQVTVNKSTPTAYTLTVNSSTPASGAQITVTPTDKNGLGNGTTSFTRSYNNGTVVTLTAASTAGGNNFLKWQLDGADIANGTGTNVTMNANHTMTAVYVVPPPTTWQDVVTVSDGCSGSKALTFGQAASATDGIDAALGEVELPPPPPAGIFDGRLVLPVTGSPASLKDYRNSSLTSASWKMTFQPGSCGYPVTFAWSTSSLPSGGTFTLKDEVGGSVVNVNMRMQSSLVLANSGISSLRIEYSPGITINVAVNAGWNLLSVPLRTPDSTVTVLFPGATTPAYGYTNGYVTSSTLSVGKGYWLKFGSAGTFPIFGSPVSPRNIAVVAGWNLIGTFETNVLVSGITSAPAGIIATPFYGYNNGYITATTLLPGQGYWVKTTQAGTLILPSSGAAALAKSAAPVEEAFNTAIAITVQDNSGMVKTLYLTQEAGLSGMAELPPLPPSGVFDVRFSGNTNVEALEEARHEIQVSSAVYPLTIQASNLNGKTLLLKDGVDGKLLNEPMGEGRVITVTSKLSSLVLLHGDGIAAQTPVTFSLSQNYPNPFNPSTVIQFALPKASMVKLTVYNVLGEVVRELTNREFEAGQHSVQFNADGFASGVYFYRIDAGTFTAIKRMALMK